MDVSVHGGELLSKARDVILNIRFLGSLFFLFTCVLVYFNSILRFCFV